MPTEASPRLILSPNLARCFAAENLTSGTLDKDNDQKRTPWRSFCSSTGELTESPSNRTPRDGISTSVSNAVAARTIESLSTNGASAVRLLVTVRKSKKRTFSVNVVPTNRLPVKPLEQIVGQYSDFFQNESPIRNVHFIGHLATHALANALRLHGRSSMPRANL